MNLLQSLQISPTIVLDVVVKSRVWPIETNTNCNTIAAANSFIVSYSFYKSDFAIACKVTESRDVWAVVLGTHTV